VRRYTGEEIHGFMVPDYRSDEPRWIDAKAFDAESDAVRTAVLRQGEYIAGGLAESKIAILTKALNDILEGNLMMKYVKWKLQDVIQEHYRIARKALKEIQNGTG